MYGLYFHGKVREIMAKHDKDETYFSGTYTFSNDDLTLEPYGTYSTDFGNNTITLSDPPYNSRDLLKEFNEAKFTIEVLKEIIQEMGVDVEKRLSQKKFLDKLSGEEDGEV